jgi:chromosomal replication initiation ATPase DnaA
MARIWANRHVAEFISARRTPQLELLIYKWVNEISENPSIRKYFVIDDADEINNDVLLFCIYNTIIGVGAYMLLTARKAPTRWRVSLGDARSRLSTINVVSIRRPTEEAFARIVDTMLRQRGILIPESALLGIINQTERSYESAINIVEAIDNIRDYSRSKISRIVRQILNNP